MRGDYLIVPQLRPFTKSLEKSTKTWQLPTPVARFELLLLGDTSFGENYQEQREAKGRRNILAKYGYDHGFERVDPLLRQADLVVANLETPLTALRSSPFADIRQYIHYSDPALAPVHLLRHNIRAVMLANNHTHDFGEAGLLETLDVLDRHGIIPIGAGRDRRAAHEPLRIRAELADTQHSDGSVPRRVSLFNVFHGGRQFRDELKAYAVNGKPGSAQLLLGSLTRKIEEIKNENADEFVIVAPHWRRDYQWRSERQAEAARRLTEAGADLIVGHGSHMLQEIEKFNGRWVINGVGNFLFNSRGRYQSTGAPPYSLIAKLTFAPDRTMLRLYPIMTNNRRTRYQPMPVTAEQFQEVHKLLQERTNAADDFGREFEAHYDEHGRHFTLQLDRPSAMATRGAR